MKGSNFMPDDAALVTAFLADRHVACPACGYDLRGAGSRCPECGEDLGLAVIAPTRRRQLMRGRLRVVGLGLLAVGVIAGIRDAWYMHAAWSYLAFIWLQWVAIAFDAFAAVLGALMVRSTRRGRVGDSDALAAAGLLVVYVCTALVVSVISMVVALLGVN